MRSPCCILRVGPLEADAEKESAARLFFGDQRLIREAA